MVSKLQNIIGSQKFYSFSGSIITAGFSLISFSLLARGLSIREFGLWTFFLTIYSFSELVMNGLVGLPLVKMGSEGGVKYQGSLISGALKICLWAILGISVLVGLVFWIVWLISGDDFYIQIIYWFTICSLVSIPMSFAVWTNSIRIKFQKVTIVTGSMKFLFMCGSIIVYIYDLDLEYVLALFALSISSTSLISLLLGWTNLKGALSGTKRYARKILDFGKFSVGTLLGSSALSSSDTMIIMAFLGPEAVALYNVPMRIIGLYDIPLRSLGQIAFPTLSRVKSKLGIKGFVKEFETSNGFTFLILFPLSLMIFIFAETLVEVIGGQGYSEATALLRIFSLYLFITPLDRFGGIALDALNRPHLNFRKMMIMLLANILGDFAAIYLEGGVTYVALASISTFALGTFISYYYLRHEVPFRFFTLLVAGNRELFRLFSKIGLVKARN
ncbi:oligosaccharide flippase family protein [Owenweeksia hongkongensis]|uniref:oligosaccharide flippase family protein n=1 Tax=Owenweeksia hongkongensis TaxID=253245 RepID=UPI003A935B45